MKKLSNLGILMTILVLGSACVSKDQLKKTLKENPDIITEAIEANPDKFIEAFQSAAVKAREVMAKKREEEERMKFEEAFEKPLEPQIRSNEIIRGKKDAPIVLVEYSDFECPYCSRGYQTVEALRKEYGDKLQFIYKHLPLSFHESAMISAQYFEAIALQDTEKAWEFHDEIFKDQKSLRNGEAFLKKLAKKVGADMGKLAKDVNSEAVVSKIKEDIEEAKKFGIQGTPGFVINGVPVRGAYPTSHFQDIISKLKEKGKIKI